MFHRDTTIRRQIYVGYGLLLRKRRYKNVLSTEQENRLALISIRLFEIEMN